MARRKEETSVPEEGVVEEGATHVPTGPSCVKYVGEGMYIMGVPTTDIHEIPAKQVATLVESGLYVLIPGCSHGE